MLNLSPNQVFHGRYQLLHVLGRGGFSEVWRAHDLTSQIDIALKVYSGVDAEGIDIFRQEFKRVFELSHTNLLKPSNFDVSREGQPYLVMRYCPNGSALKYREKADEKELARLLAGIGAALAYLHRDEVGIIHQDIKPDNFLIANNGDYLLTDFGISIEVKQRMVAHRQGEQRGSVNDSQVGVTPPAYRGPECFRREFSERLPLAATDIWALGASVYELATGEMPFGEAGGAIQDKDSKVPKLPADKGFTRTFRNLVQSCLHYDAEQRPTAKELFRKAQAFLEEGYWPTGYVPDPEEPEEPRPVPGSDKVESVITPQPIQPLIHQPANKDKPKNPTPDKRKKVDSTRTLWMVMAVIFIGLVSVFAQQIYVNFIREPVEEPGNIEASYPSEEPTINAKDREAGLPANPSTDNEPVRSGIEPSPPVRSDQNERDVQRQSQPTPVLPPSRVKIEGPKKLSGKTEAGGEDEATTGTARSSPPTTAPRTPADSTKGKPLESGKGGGGN